MERILLGAIPCVVHLELPQWDHLRSIYDIVNLIPPPVRPGLPLLHACARHHMETTSNLSQHRSIQLHAVGSEARIRLKPTRLCGQPRQRWLLRLHYLVLAQVRRFLL